MALSLSSRANSSKNSLHFPNPKGSSPHLQQPATRLYPKPEKHTEHLSILSEKVYFSVPPVGIYTNHYVFKGVVSLYNSKKSWN
jgi:hypothetical protein